MGVQPFSITWGLASHHWVNQPTSLIRSNFIYRMKLVAVLLVSVFILQAQGWPFSKREVYPTDAELAEYLARMRDEYHQDIMDLEYRPKRFGRYGNKYADNKSYGFWISALNKADNYKRGKRSVPFVPAMSPVEQEHNPFQGFPEYSDTPQLVPDKPVEKLSNN